MIKTSRAPLVSVGISNFEFAENPRGVSAREMGSVTGGTAQFVACPVSLISLSIHLVNEPLDR
jgi:hypothetical protein